MTQSQLNRAVSKATGEDIGMIVRRGFNLVHTEQPIEVEDIEALIVDWDLIQTEQVTAIFRDRQIPQLA
jgi:hypothetical protein